MFQFFFVSRLKMRNEFHEKCEKRNQNKKLMIELMILFKNGTD